MAVKPFGIAATLHDAAALAAAFGPGARIGIGAATAASADILAPSGLALQKPEILAALRLGRAQYIFTFGNTVAATSPGIIAPMIDALAHASGTGFLPACLATPWAGRTVYQGHLFLNGSLQADLKREFSTHLDGSAGVVPYPIIANGSRAVRTQLAALKEQGHRLALLDAVDADQCDILAQALAGQPIIAGPAWLSPQPATPEPEQPAGPIAILSGALARETLFQIGAARAVMPVRELNFDDTDCITAALAWAEPHIGERPFIIATSAPPDKIRAGAPAAETLARIAEALAAAGIRRFVLTGNNTAAAILARLGVTYLTAGAEFAGLRWLRAEKLSILIKPGNFGTKNLFLHEFEPQIRLNEPAE
jgi:uncharacterized protein YgbK (DUF1537 family)